MINLQVFEDLSGDLFIQISSNNLSLGRIVFASAIRESSRDASLINRTETVRVSFGNESLLVFFLIIGNAPKDLVAARFKKIGELPETDSINVLNHIVDILATFELSFSAISPPHAHRGIRLPPLRRRERLRRVYDLLQSMQA
jgi:hypothetical protein